MKALQGWFEAQGWKPLPFQREVWKRWKAGESGLLHTPTGSGKTLAAFGGPLIDALAEAPKVKRKKNATRRLRLLWITPLRALAADTLRALREPVEALDLDWRVGLRTGDASARDRRLARAGQLDALVTTPESLSLLLSYPETAAQFVGLRTIVVDEWHELLGNKRGVLLQLALARVRALAPELRTWGLSATLGNLDQARDVLLPHAPDAAVVSGLPPRTLTLDTLLPEAGERFPWAGHLGLVQLARVVERLLSTGTSLLFTNTRSQAELWHRALSAVWPEDQGTLLLHHGSIDAKLRQAAEIGLRDGSVRCVVATSSLDLGVDFPAVDQVLQVGSPKGMARLLQRAGRARHRPGEAAHVVCVPTHALELLEYAAVRKALAHGRVEPRLPPRMSLDVLAQHCVTLALGGGFDADALFDEVRGTHAFADLDHATWLSVLDFIVQGGSALSHYPDYRRTVIGDDGRYIVDDRKVAFRHRLSIGTITSDGTVAVKFLRGGALGSVEEAFVSRLKPGDRFQFAGRTLELIRLHEMTAQVKLAKRNDGMVPKWQGGRMPLSGELGREVERVLAGVASGESDSPEVRALQPLLMLQHALSALPGPEHLLCEWVKTRDGRHLFVYPFAGRAVNEGFAALVALRWGRRVPNSFSFAANDYGFVLSAQADVDVEPGLIAEMLRPEALLDDLTDSFNLTELARRQFREIARVAGLLPPSLPGRTPRSLRQLQASSGLLFDVLTRHDPGHLLLTQAQREVFAQQLDVAQLAHALDDCARRTIALHRPKSLTPLSFPLWAESQRGHLSTEDWRARVERVAAQLERRHG
ncbi:ATP-dependent helicase [Lysobacter dokdonensis DS-58]|uniref:ATP-dependent helicase n=1 Tax=Lysobacter dokdonensis DS-58 TaxID=1300345 RepID=A0A0A2WEE9_9GAMM|nr:ligase-associated DNA damage response DEXH box helicase [Lysobacter dokdonensis]KGQ18108.1 ATP-dependent helicase [Lysobacter dokdonensis DS-58]